MPQSCQHDRELSAANDGANSVAYKELLCVIKYVLGTKNLRLKIKPMGNSDESWEIVCFSNSDYAGDPVSRQSINGFILYVPVSWGSKLQKCVSLFSSETEYIALSEAVKEMMFMVQQLGSMKIAVKYPVMVRVDNIGAIFMASNVTTTCHTRHVDIRYKNVNKYAEDGNDTIIFVKSADNDSDILMKT